MPTILGALGVVAAAILGAYFYFRPRGPVEETVHHYNCVHCKRRLRYGEKQAGQSATCPICKNKFVYPPV